MRKRQRSQKRKKKPQKTTRSMKKKLQKKQRESGLTQDQFQLGLLPTQKADSPPLRSLLDPRRSPPYCLQACWTQTQTWPDSSTGWPTSSNPVCSTSGKRWLPSSRTCTTYRWCWANSGRQRTRKQQPGITSHIHGSSIGTSETQIGHWACPQKKELQRWKEPSTAQWRLTFCWKVWQRASTSLAWLVKIGPAPCAAVVRTSTLLAPVAAMCAVSSFPTTPRDSSLIWTQLISSGSTGAPQARKPKPRGPRALLTDAKPEHPCRSTTERHMKSQSIAQTYLHGKRQSIAQT